MSYLVKTACEIQMNERKFDGKSYNSEANIFTSEFPIILYVNRMEKSVFTFGISKKKGKNKLNQTFDNSLICFFFVVDTNKVNTAVRNDIIVMLL